MTSNTLFFLIGALTHSGAKREGVVPTPLSVPWRVAKWRVPARVNSGQLGSKLSSARLSSGLGSVLDLTRLRRLILRGSAQIGSLLGFARFATGGSPRRWALPGSKLFWAWLDARLGSVQTSDIGPARTSLLRLENRLGFVRGSNWHLGSKIGSVFDSRLGSV